MSDKEDRKYSEEDIREAFKAVAPNYDDVPSVNAVIAELNRPKVEFAEGEVYYAGPGIGYMEWSVDGRESNRNRKRRKLTLSELSSEIWELRDAAQFALNGLCGTDLAPHKAKIAKALAAFDEAHHEW